MAPSFDVSQLKSSPRVPSRIPLGVPDEMSTSRSTDGVYSSFDELKREEVDDSKEKYAARRSGRYGRMLKKDKVTELFGAKSFGSGREFRRGRTIRGMFGTYVGFRTQMKRYQRTRGGKNLSDNDIDEIIRAIDEVLRKLPPHMSRLNEHRALPPYAKQKILTHLLQKVRSGEITALDFDDAKMIVERMEL